MTLKTSFTLALFSLLLGSPLLRADVKSAAIFGDHMVLQQGMPVPVWGRAQPGESVTVTFAAQTRSTTAAADGSWLVHLPKLLASADPAEMTIAAHNTITIKDVLVGEVWLGSGQSNMEFSVSKKIKSFAGVNNEEQEIAAAHYPQIRMFTVKMKLTDQPQDDCEGQWQVCSPETVPAFSAVGYFFSRDLQKAIKLPVGFVNTSYGASTAQCWISKDVLAADPQYKLLLDSFAQALAAWDSGRANLPPAATQPPATQPVGTRPARRPAAPRNPHQDQHNPTLLWNAMLHPVQPFAIRGVLWYQGESITGTTAEYSALMRTLITSWRKEWGQGDFPFYFVQLAAQDAASNRPEVREAQADTLNLPNTAMAVTIDIGDKTNVHPKNKQDLGDRLARLARAKVYGEKIESSGPVFQSIIVQNSEISLKFTHVGSGLVAKGGDLKTFELAGKDGKFIPVTAKIQGDTVNIDTFGLGILPLPGFVVRYAWNRWPEVANLYNSEGLPAAPFRTDAVPSP